MTTSGVVHHSSSFAEPSAGAEVITITYVVEGDVTISTLEAALTGLPSGTKLVLGHQSVVSAGSTPVFVGTGGTVTGGSGAGVYEWDGSNLTYSATLASLVGNVIAGAGVVVDGDAVVLYGGNAALANVVDLDFGGGLAITFAMPAVVASGVYVDAAAFNGALSPTDTDLQTALATLDGP